MSEQLKAIRRRFPWNVIVVLLGLAVGIGGLAVGLYSAFHERLPNLTYEITNEADVFDVYQPRSDLVVVFQGEDIQARNLNLRILTIRISNAGEADILQDRYDQTIPWGLQIRNGKVVEQRLLTSNSSYLMANVEPTLADENTLMFSKVIFERRKYFVVEIVVLHQK
ncbi:MAG: hypothetical protein FJY85_24200, partial [Deltaproteobacteria bacterium]|nr:hypothetical protein [Deltaproteobacteria bacterium]